MKHRTLKRIFAAYVIPTIFAMFIGGIYQIIDGIFVGNYVGVYGLAGINMGWSFAAIFVGYGLAIGLGVGSLFSIAKAEGDNQKAANILGQTGFLLLVPGCLGGLVMYLFGPHLINMMGADEQTNSMAFDFLGVFSLGAPLVIGSIALPFIVRNLGSPNRATLFMAIGALLNIIFSYVFIVYLDWAVLGAAIASLIGETVAMFLGIHFVFSKNNQLKPVLNNFIPNFGLMKSICLNGSSGFFMYIYVGFIMLFSQKMLVEYADTHALAIYTMLGYIFAIYYLTVEGVANGVQPIISDLYGMNKVRSLRVIIRMALVFGIGIGVIFTLLLQLFPSFFASLFIKKEAMESLMALTTRAIRLNLFALFLEGIFVIATVFFEALGEGQNALWITLSNLLIQIPFLLILPRYFGADGVWITMPLTSILLLFPISIMVYLRYKKIE